MKLDPAESARRAVKFRRDGAAAPSSAASHAERVSISEQARAASRAAGRPALGYVRWYRAVRRPDARRRVAEAIDDPAWIGGAEGAAPIASDRIVSRNARAAIAAYRANMLAA